MNVIDNVFSARPYDWNTKPSCKSRFVVEASTSNGSLSDKAAREIRDKKPGPTDFSDNLVVDLVRMLFPINAKRRESGFGYRGRYAICVRRLGGSIEPHGYEALVTLRSAT